MKNKTILKRLVKARPKKDLEERLSIDPSILDVAGAIIELEKRVRKLEGKQRESERLRAIPIPV